MDSSNAANTPEPSPAKARFLATAIRIGGMIKDRKVNAKDGSVAWQGPRTRGSLIYMAGLGPALYDGTAGVAIFLAALARNVSDEELRHLSLEAVAPLRRLLAGLAADQQRAAEVRLRIGGIVGLCSFIYSFTKLSDLLGEPSLLEEAHRCTALLTPERIEGDQRLDVFAGSAGAILALLNLEQKRQPGSTEGANCIDLACACAQHLLAEQKSWEGHPRAWAAPGKPPMTGFAHGAAGISYALLRLYERVDRAEYLEAALEGLEFERSFYLSEHRNWRDLRFEEIRTMTSYCHGGPGIALARLAIRRIVGDARIDEEIAIGIETTVRHGLGQLDHLCCGNMSRAEILLVASQILSRPDLRDRAEELASQVLDRAERMGRFSWVPVHQDLFDPTLFSGAAGIGYALLRLAEPSQYPCLLLME
jgi:type 2 lantibiotic biosynthesis protein LanM